MSESDQATGIYRFLTRREFAITIIAGAVAFVLGVWVGVWSVPEAALAVPVDQYQDQGRTVYNAAYRPVPSSLPWLSIGVVGIALWAAWYVTHPGEEPEEIEAVDRPTETDGGAENDVDRVTICKEGCRPVFAGVYAECPECGSRLVRTAKVRPVDVGRSA